MTLGTFDYISPEQALDPRDADVRSDIYSLGCTFYHALTGQAPVPEGTAARKLHCHEHEAPIDPRQLNPDVPDDVAAILARMMAKNPKNRYQRPEHLVQHLVMVAQRLGLDAEAPEGLLFVDAPLPSQPRPRPVLLALAGVAVLIAIIVLLGQASPVDTPRDMDQPRNGPVATDTEVKKQSTEASRQASVKDPQPKKSLSNGVHQTPLPVEIECPGTCRPTYSNMQTLQKLSSFCPVSYSCPAI